MRLKQGRSSSLEEPIDPFSLTEALHFELEIELKGCLLTASATPKSLFQQSAATNVMFLLTMHKITHLLRKTALHGRNHSPLLEYAQILMTSSLSLLLAHIMKSSDIVKHLCVRSRPSAIVAIHAKRRNRMQELGALQQEARGDPSRRRRSLRPLLPPPLRPMQQLVN